MKKQMISVCAATVLAASVLAGGAVQAFAAAGPVDGAAPAAVEAENCIAGAWKRADDPDLTDQVRTLFDRAFDGLTGVAYTPCAVLATRTTAEGRQYRVLCKAAVVYPGAQEEYVVVTLQRGWLCRAEILEIGDPLCRTDLDGEPMPGGWQEAATPAMTEEAAAAFEKATEGLVGVDYVPVALLSEQVVAGTNYRILCEATVVYPGAGMHYAVVTVSVGPEGTADLIGVADGSAG